MLRPTNNKKSKLQERKGSRLYGGSLNSGSGNGWIRKADVRNKEELFEFKVTGHDSYRITVAELAKFWNQALIDNRIPIFEIEFSDRLTCVVLDKEDYLAIRKRELLPVDELETPDEL